MAKKHRVGQDGKPAVDVEVNPAAVARKLRAAEEKKRIDEEAASPWSRERMIREIARVNSADDLGTVNGKVARQNLNLHGADLSGLDLSGLDLTKANMHGVRAVKTNFSGCRMVEANLNDAILAGAILDKVQADEATFHGACMCSAKVNGATFLGSNLSESCCESTEGISPDAMHKANTHKMQPSCKRKRR